MQSLKGSKKELEKVSHKRKKRTIRRSNAKLYPIYKMFSLDLLCFYSIQFLFYTITKGIDASQVLIASAFYLVSKIIMQIPSVVIADLYGHRKSLILGNFLTFLGMIFMIFVSGFESILVANIILAFGYDIKIMSETNLLYDSVSTRGGEGLYSKIDSKGSSWYYLLDGILCLIAGYLFVINNYIPVYICAIFTLISTILSFKFQDVHKKKDVGSKDINQILKEYRTDLKVSIKFIMKSRRMKSYLLFGAAFYGIIKLVATYKSELLISQGVSEQEFSTIFAIITLISGISTSYSRKFHKKFKNKTLSVLSLTFVAACLIASISARTFSNNVAIPITIACCTIFKIGEALWFVLEYKYLKNFTTENVRNKITFTYETVICIGASIMSLLGSLLLKIVNINDAFLLVSLVFLILIVVLLDYMRTRMGLRPNEYKKEDIDIDFDLD